MESFYMMTTADELEWPIAVGRSLKELSEETGKDVRSLHSKLFRQRMGYKTRGYRIEFVEIEEDISE